MLRGRERTLLAISHDIAAVAISWLLAYLLRFNLSIPEEYLPDLWKTLALALPLQSAILWSFGLYRGIWRYASIPDMKRILSAVAAGALLVPTLRYMIQLEVVIPRSVLILEPILLVVIMGGSRIFYRAWKEKGFSGSEGKPVLILGAGDDAANLAKSLARSNEWRVAGILDDAKQGRMIHGVRVLGGLSELPQIANSLAIEHAIIAMPSASHQARKKAMDLCRAASLKALTVPSFDDLMSGKVSISEVRKIELDDLLGRDPVELDENGLSSFLSGKTVMVTGAGGSIGSELCRQIAKFSPGKIVLFELSEYSLYNIEQEFRSRYPETAIVAVIGDVKNHDRVREVLATHRPAAIFHAAAYKHVPLMEEENAWEAVKNNVLGTYTLAREAKIQGAEKFVLISTDKAVNPTNVMGASKRLAELVCQSLQEENSTRFVMVRFGNVLGSAGSVIPKFNEQIAKGGPVTVTHPEITRYFMSIPEAAQLVLQAGLMGKGGEIFVLDMGEPVKIVDLARELIRLSGLSENDIEIRFTGLRPGEKLYEELLADDEVTLPTPHPKLRIARAKSAEPERLGEIFSWIGKNDAESDENVRRQLQRLVPEYLPAKR